MLRTCNTITRDIGWHKEWHVVIGWVVVGMLIWPSVTSAQQAVSAPPRWGAAFDVSDGRVQIDGYAVSQVATAAPRVWVTTGIGRNAQFRGSAGGTLSRFASGHLAGYAEGYTAVVADTARPVRMTWNVRAGTGAYRGQISSAYMTSGVHVEYPNVASVSATPFSVWGAADIGKVGVTHRTYTTRHTALGTAARWRALITTLSMDLTNARHLISARDITYTDIIGRARWHADGGVQAELTVGTRTGVSDVGRRRWADLSGVLPFIGRSALVVSGGIVPSDPARGALGARYTAVALRLTFGAAARRSPLLLRIRDDERTVVSDVHPDGSRTLLLTLPNARTVEIMGDFTDWHSVAMTRAPDGRWHARISLAPGAHRMNVRIDGNEWSVPPGLPVTPDDFGGTVGVLTIH